MKHGFHILMRQILSFCDPHTTVAHEDMLNDANGFYEE